MEESTATIFFTEQEKTTSRRQSAQRRRVRESSAASMDAGELEFITEEHPDAGRALFAAAVKISRREGAKRIC